MASDPRHHLLDRHLDAIIGPFADLLLATDLPLLPAERRDEVVHFVQRRAASMPSFTRFGVTMIGLIYRALLALPGGPRAVLFLMSRPLPGLSDYPRLVRSLSYAYVWERWPDTSPTGAMTPAGAPR
jgi:hypothetical protein